MKSWGALDFQLHFTFSNLNKALELKWRRRAQVLGKTFFLERRQTRVYIVIHLAYDTFSYFQIGQCPPPHLLKRHPHPFKSNPSAVIIAVLAITQDMLIYFWIRRKKLKCFCLSQTEVGTTWSLNDNDQGNHRLCSYRSPKPAKAIDIKATILIFQNISGLFQ